MAIKPGQRLLFVGDSITDCGRFEPATPYGKGYVAIIRGLICAQTPTSSVKCVNRGIGGDTTVELERRWEEDVIALEPDWLSVLIGINDCHRYLSGDPNTGPEDYAERYESLLERTTAALDCSLVLLEPFYFALSPGGDEQQRQVLTLLPEYMSTVHRLAHQFSARLVRTHEIGQAIIREQGPEVLCPEPVHPNLTGHAVIAHALWQALQNSG